MQRQGSKLLNVAWWVWWVGGVRLLSSATASPGAMGWDGMERGPGARINSGQSLASGSSRLQDSIMSLNHRVASNRIVRRRRAQERSKKKKR